MKSEGQSKPGKPVRQPKQPRSIGRKEKVLDAALGLFSEKGYYQTTTNEIARTAGVSIGTLYAYFENKDTILLEILGRFHERFGTATRRALADADLYQADKKEWFRILIMALIEEHERSANLIKELNAIYYVNPQVAAVLDENRNQTREATLQYILQHSDDLKVKDQEAASIVAFELISAIVDRVAFGNNSISRERIINAGIEAIYKFLAE
jgi:AcrR family transcriptional regulator